jgi:hypothetical protein
MQLPNLPPSQPWLRGHPLPTSVLGLGPAKAFIASLNAYCPYVGQVREFCRKQRKGVEQHNQRIAEACVHWQRRDHEAVDRQYRAAREAISYPRDTLGVQPPMP